jgi:integrase
MTRRFADDGSGLFTALGERKYLVANEIQRLFTAAKSADPDTQLFCRTLFYTGCRLSEALALSPRLLDHEQTRITFRTLKRRRTVYRSVPVPPSLMRQLMKRARRLGPDDRLFPWSRATGWRRFKRLCEIAGIERARSSPKAMRHSYGCDGIILGVPESLLKKLLGHADIASTQIYTGVLGQEECQLTKRMWRRRC